MFSGGDKVQCEFKNGVAYYSDDQVDAEGKNVPIPRSKVCNVCDNPPESCTNDITIAKKAAALPPVHIRARMWESMCHLTNAAPGNTKCEDWKLNPFSPATSGGSDDFFTYMAKIFKGNEVIDVCHPSALQSTTSSGCGETSLSIEESQELCKKMQALQTWSAEAKEQFTTHFQMVDDLLTSNGKAALLAEIRGEHLARLKAATEYDSLSPELRSAGMNETEKGESYRVYYEPLVLAYASAGNYSDWNALASDSKSDDYMTPLIAGYAALQSIDTEILGLPTEEEQRKILAEIKAKNPGLTDQKIIRQKFDEKIAGKELVVPSDEKTEETLLKIAGKIIEKNPSYQEMLTKLAQGILAKKEEELAKEKPPKKLEGQALEKFKQQAGQAAIALLISKIFSQEQQLALMGNARTSAFREMNIPRLFASKIEPRLEAAQKHFAEAIRRGGADRFAALLNTKDLGDNQPYAFDENYQVSSVGIVDALKEELREQGKMPGSQAAQIAELQKTSSSTAAPSLDAVGATTTSTPAAGAPAKTAESSKSAPAQTKSAAATGKADGKQKPQGKGKTGAATKKAPAEESLADRVRRMRREEREAAAKKTGDKATPSTKKRRRAESMW